MTTDERLANLEGRFDTLMETLASQLATMNERISDLQRTVQTWFMGMTAILAAILAVLITIAFRTP